MLSPELLDKLPDHNRLWLALSGGLDSVVLLDIAAKYCAKHQVSLNVIHVHHGLSPNANKWAQHCLKLCQSYQERLAVPVTCHVAKVQLDTVSSVEEQARKARYQVFEAYLKAQDLMLMAHHGDDQLETLLLRLMRGAGALGLSGMPVKRRLGQGRLYRPLLQFERSVLEEYAAKNALSWVEDESNQRLEFDRNYLRHQITPRLKSRWPNLIRVAGRSAQVLSDTDKLNNDLAEIDLQSVAVSEAVLSCPALLALSSERQHNLLRFWLQGAAIASLDYRQITTIIQDLVLAQDDAQPLFRRPGFEIRRYRHQLFLKRTDTCADVEQDKAQADKSMGGTSVFLTDRASAKGYLLTDGVTFQIEPVSDSQVDQGTEMLRLPLSCVLSLSHRKGGESFCLRRRGRKTLKKLLQEAGVPAWLRDQVRLFWLQSNEQKHLIGAWSPQLETDDPCSDNVFDNNESGGKGIFWWDIRVLNTEKETAAYAARDAGTRMVRITRR